MTANTGIVLEFKVKLFHPNKTTSIIDVMDTLYNITEKYDLQVYNGEIENFQVYFRLHGSYQKVAEGVLDYEM